MSSESPKLTDQELQRQYYAKAAEHYDAQHIENPEEQEHALALAALSGWIEHFQIRSVLDVGAGTGRLLRYFAGKEHHFERLLGVEPVKELREAGYAAGVPEERLIEGDALRLPFADGEFELVCAFAILHHIPDPNRAVREMFRVARRGVFLSDLNNFGCGSAPTRIFKQTLHTLGLWPLMQKIVTRGKGYKFSEEDGIHYSYSLYDSLPVIREYCLQPTLVTTKGFGINPYRSCSHVAFLAMKDRS